MLFHDRPLLEKIFPVAETISGIVALSLPKKEVFI